MRELSRSAPQIRFTCEATSPSYQFSAVTPGYRLQSSDNMAPSKPLHMLYAQGFQYDSLGYGLLHPCSSDRLLPGVCGYFDEEGDWRTIVDIVTIAPGKPSALGDLQLS